MCSTCAPVSSTFAMRPRQPTTFAAGPNPNPTSIPLIIGCVRCLHIMCQSRWPSFPFAVVIVVTAMQNWCTQVCLYVCVFALGTLPTRWRLIGQPVAAGSRLCSSGSTLLLTADCDRVLDNRVARKCYQPDTLVQQQQRHMLAAVWLPLSLSLTLCTFLRHVCVCLHAMPILRRLCQISTPKPAKPAQPKLLGK